VLTERDLTAGYEIDWSRRFRGRALAVVRPGTPQEVATCLALCSGSNVAVVCQGGNTGLVGGGVPRGGEVVLSLRRLDAIGEVDLVASQVTVGAGATLAAVQAHVRAVGLDVAIDFGARDSATMGGMVATNAGGMQVFRQGSMRRQVLGIEVALPDGSLVERMSGLVKDNVGYDLASLLAGSEGTLGAITQLRLRLVPREPETAVALIGLDGFEGMLALARSLARALPSARALEFFDDLAMGLVERHRGLARPLPPSPYYLLVECAGTSPVHEQLVGALAELGLDEGVAVALDAASARALWAYREQLTEALNVETVPIKLDVTLPLGALATFAEHVRDDVRTVLPDARTVLFGHLLDGNVHVNVNDPVTNPASDEALTERVERAVLVRVAALGGSISAEHGIGVAKAPYLSLGRSEADIAAMRAIKRALDPAGIMNPGVIFEG
jgi:FAD/FMN-containing dehydrogenase